MTSSGAERARLSARGQYFVMLATARLVRFLRANQYDRIIHCSRSAIHQALRSAGGFAANDTYRLQLDHFFRDAQ